MNLGRDDYVAQNSYWRSKDGKIIEESDMNFNMYHAFANSAQVGAFDVFSVFLHEAGHTAGLSHSSNTSAVMYGESYTNRTRRVLTQDDKDGIKAIYK